jgi:hypothetical protein
MNNRSGLFMVALGVALIVLSESPIFQFIVDLEERRHPMQGESNGVVLITFMLMALGITFLLVGAYQYMSAGEK